MNSRLVLGLVVLLVAGVVAAIIFQPPIWIVLPLGFAILAALFIAVRRNTGYDAVDPTFRDHNPITKQPDDR